MKLPLSLTLLVLIAACDGGPVRDRIPGGALRLGSVLGETDLAGYLRAEVPRTFRFPADNGAHPGYRSEWWYLTVSAEDEHGAEFGVQFTLFRQALSPAAPAAPEGGNRWQSNQAYLAHFAVTDVAAARHLVDERIARGHPSLAGVSASPFAAWIEDWRLAEVGTAVQGAGRWRLEARASRHAVDLVLDVSVPRVLQGEQGLSRKGPGQASYYYSQPRIPVSGTITVDGSSRVVRGLGWLDREWSTSLLSDGQLGWDWFALMLERGDSLMLFQLRREDGRRDPFDQGLLVDATGRRQTLDAEDFQLEPLEFWRDAAGVEWPVAWRVNVGDEQFRVVAALDDQRMDTAIVYWEGLVHVFAELDGQPGPALGEGYLELTGYRPADDHGPH